MYGKYRAVRLRLCEILVQKGIISTGQLEQALMVQKSEGGRIGEILVRMHTVKESEIADTLASQIGIPYINLDNFLVDKAVVHLVPAHFAKREEAFPICLTGKILTVAMADPLDFKAIEDLEALTKLKVEPVVAIGQSIRKCIQEHYGDQLNDVQIDKTRKKIILDNHDESYVHERIEGFAKMSLAKGDRRDDNRRDSERRVGKFSDKKETPEIGAQPVKVHNSTAQQKTNLAKEREEKECVSNELNKLKDEQRAMEKKNWHLAKERISHLQARLEQEEKEKERVTAVLKQMKEERSSWRKKTQFLTKEIHLIRLSKRSEKEVPVENVAELSKRLQLTSATGSITIGGETLAKYASMRWLAVLLTAALCYLVGVAYLIIS